MSSEISFRARTHAHTPPGRAEGSAARGLGIRSGTEASSPFSLSSGDARPSSTWPRSLRRLAIMRLITMLIKSLFPRSLWPGSFPTPRGLVMQPMRSRDLGGTPLRF